MWPRQPRHLVPAATLPPSRHTFAWGFNKLNFTSRSSDFSEILVLEKEFLEIASKLEICQSLLYEKPLCSSLNGQIEGGLAIPCPPEKRLWFFIHCLYGFTWRDQPTGIWRTQGEGCRNDKPGQECESQSCEDRGDMFRINIVTEMLQIEMFNVANLVENAEASGRQQKVYIKGVMVNHVPAELNERWMLATLECR